MSTRDLVASDTGLDTGPDAESGAASYSRSHETAAERLDRNWNDLLQELRVVQTGVQILTGFLLTVPFQQRFWELSETQHRLYLALVVAAVTTIGLLIAPVGMHRVLFRQRQKDTLIELADRLALAGLFCLCVVVSGVLLLVFDVVVSRAAALAVSLTMFFLLLIGWFAVPLVVRMRGRRGAPGQNGVEGTDDDSRVEA